MIKTLFSSAAASRVGQISRLSLAVAASACLAACGGGGGGGGTSLDRADFQGRWTTPNEAAPSYIAIVVPSASSNTTSDAWALRQDGKALAQLFIESNGSSSGTLFSFTGAAPVPISGGVDLDQAVTPKTLALPGLAAGSTAFNQADNLAGTAALADVAGTWDAQYDTNGDNQVDKTVIWTVTATGEIVNGSDSSTGCEYRGSLAPVNSAKAYTAVFSEECKNDTSVAAYTGVATVNPDKTQLTVVAIANDRTKPIAFLLSRSKD